MFVLRLFLTLFIVIFMHVQGYASVLNAHNHEVDVVTNMGVIRIELFEDKAPISVQNFLVYASDGFYNSTLFHRTIKDFMIQGGGFTADMIEKRHFPPIQNEAKNGLSNDRGTVAMARTKEINSSTSQFFINVSNNAFLNHSSRDYGYTVFGKVISGMDVVDSISELSTKKVGDFKDVPKKQVIIESMHIQYNSEESKEKIATSLKLEKEREVARIKDEKEREVARIKDEKKREFARIKDEKKREAARIKAEKELQILGKCEIGNSIFHRERWKTTTSSGNILADSLFGAATKEEFIISFEGVVEGFVSKKVKVTINDYKVQQTVGGGFLQPNTYRSHELEKYADKYIGKIQFYDRTRCE